ncbi:MAG: hypothetical protein Q9168_006402 [Polycauliona sp. 1 TL-2023]
MSSQLPFNRQDHLSKSYSSTPRPPIAPPYSTGQPLRLPSASHSYAHTLPPLSSHDYPYTYPNDPTQQRAHTSSSSYNIPTSSAHPNQNSPYNFDQQNFTPVPRTFQSPTSYAPPSWSPQTSTSQNYQFGNPTAASNALPSLLPMPNGNQQNTLYQQPPIAPAGAPFEQHHSQQPNHQQPRQQPSQHSQYQPKQAPQQHPTHVVGSQGRRGILPSALGRPPAVPADGAQGGIKMASTPAKDSEGKFPCEHCNKNYLHAKHLKRHMLRHTGQRPYACGLCDDTFSRSDILKRHFQKCSVRRGNPTGASHLTHSRASKKGKPIAVEQLPIPLANASATASSSSNSGPPSQVQQQASQGPTSTPTVQSPYELQVQGLSTLGLGTAAYQEELQSFSTRASRASSVKRSSNGMTINSRTASGPSSAGGPDSAFSYSTGQVTPDSLTTSGAATPYSIHHDGRLPFSPDGAYHPNGSSGIDLSRPHSGPPAHHMANSHHPHIMGSANGSRHDMTDLAHFFSNANGNGHDDFQTHYSTNGDDGAHHVNVKAEHQPDFHYGYNGFVEK